MCCTVKAKQTDADNAMATSKKLTKKGPKLVPEVVTETPFDEPTPVESAPAAAAEPIPPKKARGRQSQTAQGSFWQRLMAIPKEEWESKRSYLYLYLMEPFVNIKTEGEAGYLSKLYEPIEPDFIMNRWGSGKYFARLKHRVPGQNGDTDVDKLTFEIVNPAYPPKLPRKMWEHDPRNERWLSMLPKESDGKQTTAAETAQLFQTFLQMKDSFSEGTEQQDATSQLETTVNIASRLMEMAKPKEAAPPADPWDAASKILNMRSDNPVVDMMREELKAIREELKEERTEARRLQQQLFEGKNKTAEEQKPKTLVEQLNELKALRETFAGVIETGAKSRMSGTLEFFSEVVPKLVESPLMVGLGNFLMSKAMQPSLPMQQPMNGVNGTQAQRPQQPANGQQPQQATAEQELLQFVHFVTPSMLRYLEGEQDGGSFAESVYFMFPDKLPILQTLTHPSLPNLSGAPVVIAFYKMSPYWNRIQLHEARFTQFIQDFCKWRPDEGEDGKQAQPVNGVAAASVDDGTEGSEPIPVDV